MGCILWFVNLVLLGFYSIALDWGHGVEKLRLERAAQRALSNIIWISGIRNQRTLSTNTIRDVESSVNG